MSDTETPPDPFDAVRQTLLEVLPPLLALLQRPDERRQQLRDTLRSHLQARKASLQWLQASASQGQGTLAAAQFEAELARVNFAESQLAHLGEQALVYTLGVFAIDGRPGDYVSTDRPTTKAADRD